LVKKRDISILHVTPWYPPHKSGLGNYVSNLCTHLRDQGYKISILTVKRLTEKAYSKGGNNNDGYDNIDYINSIYLPGWPYATLRSISIPIDGGAKINSCIKKGDFDIVHVHALQYPICWLAIYLAHRYRIPSVLTLHGTYPILNPSKETKIEQLLYRHLFSRILSQACAVIGPAESITSFARGYLKEPSTSFHTVKWGLDTDRFVHNLDKKIEYRKKHNLSESAKVLMFSGRFEKIKGILEFSKAAKKIVEESNKKVEAIIVGSGTLKDQVHSIVNDTSGIQIFDWQPEEKIHQFYIASDIIVVPSRSEAMPITVLEAMNAGLHIVYAPVGGIPDILKGYSSKTPLKQISDREIYDVLLKLISSDLDNPDLMNSLTYAQSFDWIHTREEIIRVYGQLIS
jgi:glycosyltransferase involved in cell wall biosynthesis